MAAADVDEPGVSDGDETKNKVNFQTFLVCEGLTVWSKWDDWS